jgi:hypothetical protein
MASAAMRLRPPDRQMKNNSASLSAPAAASASPRRSGNAASIRLSGDVCHSTVKTLLSRSERSGRPTNAHSARVRTSMSTAPLSSLRRAHTSSTGTSSMWTTSIDCTFVLHHTDQPEATSSRPRYRILPSRTNNISTRQASSPERYAKTHQKLRWDQVRDTYTNPGIGARSNWYANRRPNGAGRPRETTPTIEQDASPAHAGRGPPKLCAGSVRSGGQPVN